MVDLIIKETRERGRGVFAARDFHAGDIIEICPVIVLSSADAAKLDNTYLYNYYFGWGDDNKAAAIALGYGSLYNHSTSSNAFYQKNLTDCTISIIAVKAIAPEDEILITYNFGNSGDGAKAWFTIK